MRFEQATAVEQVGEGRYRAQVHEGWDIWGKANGGYLAAVAGRAAAHATGKPDPLTITAHYLAPAAAGRGADDRWLRPRHVPSCDRPLYAVLCPRYALAARTNASDATPTRRYDDGTPRPRGPGGLLNASSTISPRCTNAHASRSPRSFDRAKRSPTSHACQASSPGDVITSVNTSSASSTSPSAARASARSTRNRPAHRASVVNSMRRANAGQPMYFI